MGTPTATGPPKRPKDWRRTLDFQIKRKSHGLFYPMNCFGRRLCSAPSAHSILLCLKAILWLGRRRSKRSWPTRKPRSRRKPFENVLRAMFFPWTVFGELLFETKESARRVHLAWRAHDLSPVCRSGGRMIREPAVTWAAIIIRNLRRHEDLVALKFGFWGSFQSLFAGLGPESTKRQALASESCSPGG